MNYSTLFFPELFQGKISRFMKYAAVAAFVLSVLLIPMAQDAHAIPEPPNPSIVAYRPWVETGPKSGRVGPPTTQQNCLNVTLPALINLTFNFYGEEVTASGCRKDVWAQSYME